MTCVQPVTPKPVPIFLFLVKPYVYNFYKKILMENRRLNYYYMITCYYQQFTGTHQPLTSDSEIQPFGFLKHGFKVETAS